MCCEVVRYTFVNELGHLNAVGGGHTRRFQHDCAGVSPRPFGAEVQLPLNQPTVSPSGKVANNNISQLASQLANQLASGASHPPERCKWRQAKQELFKKKKKQQRLSIQTQRVALSTHFADALHVFSRPQNKTQGCIKTKSTYLGFTNSFASRGRR